MADEVQRLIRRQNSKATSATKDPSEAAVKRATEVLASLSKEEHLALTELVLKDQWLSRTSQYAWKRPGPKYNECYTYPNSPIDVVQVQKAQNGPVLTQVFFCSNVSDDDRAFLGSTVRKTYAALSGAEQTRLTGILSATESIDIDPVYVLSLPEESHLFIIRYNN